MDAASPQREAFEADIAAWIATGSAAGARPWVVAVNGPQGCGKSTLCAAACAHLAQRGVHAETVSIDDFYLPHAEQQALAARHRDNRYLAVRGYPGTHDVELGARVL